MTKRVTIQYLLIFTTTKLLITTNHDNYKDSEDNHDHDEDDDHDHDRGNDYYDSNLSLHTTGGGVSILFKENKRRFLFLFSLSLFFLVFC